MDGNLQSGLLVELRGLASALRALGNNDAATPMGAIENLAVTIERSSGNIADALREIAQAIADRE
jgi:hypothetical protein